MLRWDRDKAHALELRTKVAREQEKRREVLHKTSIKPINIRAGLAEQRKCERQSATL